MGLGLGWRAPTPYEWRDDVVAWVPPAELARSPILRELAARAGPGRDTATLYCSREQLASHHIKGRGPYSAI